MGNDYELDRYQRQLDANAKQSDAILCRARQISREYQQRGLTIAWEICHQEAEDEILAMAEGPDRNGE